ncbi:MAG: hypothetical protein IJS45_00480 [Clostridia bacterium]|nr:hypothetical protein [Clostridia bacterium]
MKNKRIISLILTLCMLLALLPAAAFAGGMVGGSNYMLIGTFNDWTSTENDVLTEVEGFGGNEYVLLGKTLSKDCELQIVQKAPFYGAQKVYFPESRDDAYTVAADGVYNVHFRPNKDGGDGWYDGCIKLVPANADKLKLHVISSSNPDDIDQIIAFVKIGAVKDLQKLEFTINIPDELILDKDSSKVWITAEKLGGGASAVSFDEESGVFSLYSETGFSSDTGTSLMRLSCHYKNGSSAGASVGVSGITATAKDGSEFEVLLNDPVDSGDRIEPTITMDSIPGTPLSGGTIYIHINEDAVGFITITIMGQDIPSYVYDSEIENGVATFHPGVLPAQAYNVTADFYDDEHMGYEPYYSMHSAAFLEAYTVLDHFLWVGDTEVTKNCTSGNGWEYVPSTNTLTLNNFTYEGDGHAFTDNSSKVFSLSDSVAAITYLGSDTLNLVIEGENSVSLTVNDAEYPAGIYSCGGVNISGSGSLDVTVCDAKKMNFGLYAGESLTVNGGVLRFVCGHAGGMSRAVDVFGDLTIKDGDVYAAGGEADDYISYGIFAKGKMEISGGKVTALGGKAKEFSAGVLIGDDFDISGGTVYAASVDAELSCGVMSSSEPHTLTIGDGVVSFVSTGNSSALEDQITVKNLTDGIGWNNAEGTGEGTAIAVNTEGAALGYKKVKFTFIHYNLWVGDTEVTSACTSGDGWNYVPETNTLTLNGYTYQGQGHVFDDNGNGAAIYYSGADALTISLSGVNHITPIGTKSGDCGIVNDGGGTLTFSGDGSLLIDSVGGFKYYSSAINSRGSVVFSSGTFTLGNNDADYGVRVGSDSHVVIEAGVSSFAAKGYMAAIQGNVKNAMAGTGYDAYKTRAGRLEISSTGAPFTYTSGLQTKYYQIVTFPVGQYQVIFSAGDGSGSIDPTTISEGEKLKLPPCTFTPPKDDYENDKTFNWWDVSGADGVYYVDSDVLISDNCAFNGVVTVTARWKAKTDSSILMDAEGQELDYTGSAQALLSHNGIAIGGAMVYAFGEDNVTAPTDGWDTELPTKTDAGTYYIWYKVSGDSDHFDSAAKCTVAKIKPISGLTVSLDDDAYTYDGSEKSNTKTPTTNAISGVTSYSYSFEQDGTYVSDLSSLKKTGAGEYTVYVKATNPNYSNVATAEAMLTISPVAAPLMISSSDKSWTYDGETHTDEAYTVIYDGTPIDADASGKIFTLPTGDTVTVTATSAGVRYYKADYSENNTFTYVLTNANSYSSVRTTAGTLSIGRYEITITADSDVRTYNETALTKNSFTAEGLAAGDSVESVTVTGSQTDPGSSENVPSAAKIVNANGEDVTGCYNITYVNGTLTVNEKPEYPAEGGETYVWTKGSGKDLVLPFNRSFDLDSCFDHFAGAKMDGKTLVRDKDYTAKRGSTVITLKAETLEALSSGEHVFTAVFDDAESEITLTIKDAPVSHQTGDNVVTLIFISALALISLAAGVYAKKKIFVK